MVHCRARRRWNSEGGSSTLEAIAKPYFTVILNEVKDLKSIKIRDSSLRSE
jgi:hypothetical protein